MSSENLSLLILFVRNVEKGKVKTRLAGSLGEKKALEIYRKLLNYTYRVSEEVPVDKQIWYSQYVPENPDVYGIKYNCRVQKGRDLGQRMDNAFRMAFNDGYNKVVIIGSDCGELTANIIQSAYHKLENNDLVIGPAEDGGYYLLGMNQYYPFLFSSKDWSSSILFDQTVDDARREGLNYSLLPKLNDVDHPDDWEMIKNKFEDS